MHTATSSYLPSGKVQRAFVRGSCEQLAISKVCSLPYVGWGHRGKSIGNSLLNSHVRVSVSSKRLGGQHRRTDPSAGALRFLIRRLHNGIEPRRPDFAALLATSFYQWAAGCASDQLRQFLPIRFVKRARRRRDPGVLVGIDVIARLSLFFGLHAIIYVLSADWYGSFGGSRREAVAVVAPTLAHSAIFENFSGVYFYATLVTAMPLYVSVFTRSKASQKRVGSLPFNLGPVLGALAVFLFTAVLLTVLAQSAARIFGKPVSDIY